MTDLRALAEAATDGRWWAESGGWVHVEGQDEPVAKALGPRGQQKDADAAYIAAANPKAILALLDERDALRAALEAVITANEHDLRLVYRTYAYANLAERARAALGPKP
jgi:hypothetical protein